MKKKKEEPYGIMLVSIWMLQGVNVETILGNLGHDNSGFGASEDVAS